MSRGSGYDNKLGSNTDALNSYKNNCKKSVNSMDKRLIKKSYLQICKTKHFTSC